MLLIKLFVLSKGKKNHIIGLTFFFLLLLSEMIMDQFIKSKLSFQKDNKNTSLCKRFVILLIININILKYISTSLHCYMHNRYPPYYTNCWWHFPLIFALKLIYCLLTSEKHAASSAIDLVILMSYSCFTHEGKPHVVYPACYAAVV